MFTGIIESMGTVETILISGENITFEIRSMVSNELKPDQSISHNGICLTVESLRDGHHTITAVKETLQKTNAGNWQKGDYINLERCMLMNGRIDGHIVQGHVDTTAVCTQIRDENGSWECRFQYDPAFAHLMIEKGSVCVNGISLTAFQITDSSFSVAIIPYTWQHTNMQFLKTGMIVNIEFDMIGKYLARFRSLVKE